MGITLVRVKIRNPENPQREFEEEFMVDSGAIYSVVPIPYLKKLGIKPHRKQEFTLLLGAFTLEALGLMLDPFKRKLKPMRLLLV